MTFKSIEEFLEYLEQAYSAPTEDIAEDTDDMKPVPIAEINSVALNTLFRNAMNSKAFNTAFDIIVYANEQQIAITKGR